MLTYEATVQTIGVYAKDSFDFDDDKGSLFSQPLGFWNIKNNSFSGTGFGFNDFGKYISNSTYREYRDLTRFGRDFMVYSTVLHIPISLTFQFTISDDND